MMIFEKEMEITLMEEERGVVVTALYSPVLYVVWAGDDKSGRRSVVRLLRKIRKAYHRRRLLLLVSTLGSVREKENHE